VGGRVAGRRDRVGPRAGAPGGGTAPLWWTLRDARCSRWTTFDLPPHRAPRKAGWRRLARGCAGTSVVARHCASCAPANPPSGAPARGPTRSRLRSWWRRDPTGALMGLPDATCGVPGSPRSRGNLQTIVALTTARPPAAIARPRALFPCAVARPATSAPMARGSRDRSLQQRALSATRSFQVSLPHHERRRVRAGARAGGPRRGDRGSATGTMPSDHGGACASPRSGAASPLFAGHDVPGGYRRSTANSGRPSKTT